MLDFSQAQIIRLAITWSGNKERNEGVVIPKSTLVPVNDYAHEVVLTTFFKPFEKNEEFFTFHHEEDVSHNAVYQSCVEIFQNPESLSAEAAKLTQRLYEYSTPAKMGGGELMVALFDNILLMNEAVPAIGLFKVTDKEPFLRVDRTSEAFTLQVGEGISTGKPTLAALIFGVDEAEGYRLMGVDKITKKDEPSVWFGQFLGAQPIEDNYFNTRQYMAMTNEFIAQKAVHQFGLNKAEKVDLLNRSSYYFKENDIFDVDDFAAALFEEPEKQDAFKEFKENYAQENAVPLAEQFDISKQAVRKNSRLFKSIIKLDDNFHIYVHGRRDLIERGYDDDKGKPFYKMYFDQEE